MSYIDELEHEMDFHQTDASKSDPDALRRTTAVSLLLAATGPGGQRAARRAAGRITAHRAAREIGAELLRLLNGCEVGGVVWGHALAVISFAIDGLFDMRLTDDGAAYVDTIYSPADQRVLLDVLLRMPESTGCAMAYSCHPYGESLLQLQADTCSVAASRYGALSAWRPWLRAATALLTAADGYEDNMYRAVDRQHTDSVDSQR